MDDFTAFLTARYDEAGASAAPGRDALDDLRFELKRGDPYEQDLSSRIEDGLDAQTMAWEAHRLADIALKRAILAEHAPVPGLPGRTICRVCWTTGRGGGPLDGDEYPCATVRQLGTEFAGHADYRPEWAPEA